MRSRLLCAAVLIERPDVLAEASLGGGPGDGGGPASKEPAGSVPSTALSGSLPATLVSVDATMAVPGVVDGVAVSDGRFAGDASRAVSAVCRALSNAASVVGPEAGVLLVVETASGLTAVLDVEEGLAPLSTDVAGMRLVNWLSRAAKRLAADDEPVASILELVEAAELDKGDEPVSAVSASSAEDETEPDDVCWIR
jgi:hypothetical protein